MAFQVAVSYAVVLVVAAWVGQWLLELLGVTIAGLTATGGLALLLAGLPLMLQGRKRQPTEEQIQEAVRQRDLPGSCSVVDPAGKSGSNFHQDASGWA